MRCRFLTRLAFTVSVLLLTGCDVSLVDAGDTLPPGATPSERALLLETTGCGEASSRAGSALLWKAGTAITAAHLVIQADTITISGVAASIAGLDPKLDLAVLEVTGLPAPVVEIGAAEVGDEGRIVAAATSGTVSYEVLTVASLSIEEVLGTERSSRLGYELQAPTTGGDSGAGAYDNADRLIGMVFASSADQTWITAADEIRTFLERPRVPHTCDASRSRQNPS